MAKKSHFPDILHHCPLRSILVRRESKSSETRTTENKDFFFSCLEEKERESQKGKERKIKAITNSVIGGNNILSKKKKEKRKY